MLYSLMTYHVNRKSIFKLLFLGLIFLLLSLQVKAQTIFLAVNGEDTSTGSISNPLRTLEAALKKNNAAQNDSLIIYLRAGRYNISKEILLSNNKQKIRISAYKKETVLISGGVEIDPKKFGKVTKHDVLQRLTDEAKLKVITVNLETLGITDFGTLKMTGFGKKRMSSALELFQNGSPLTLARWPNNELLSIGNIITSTNSRNVKDSTDLPSFTYAYSRPEQWKPMPNIWISGILSEKRWADDVVPVKHIDILKKVITLNAQTVYGISPDNSSVKKSQSDLKGYYFFNILEELDMPGEWYLDRATSDLYLWPNSQKNNSFQISLLESNILRLNDATNIIIENITFTCSRTTFIRADRSSDVTINNCKFTNGGLGAIKASRCSSFIVKNSLFKNLGAGAVEIDGGDRKALKASGNIIQNSEFRNYSRVYKSYSPAVTMSGVGNVIKNCVIGDAPGQAIVFYGNDHIISNNIITNTCYGFSDIGAIYTGRDPSSRGTMITNNYFADVRGIGNNKSVTAIYMDDGSGGQNISNNFFYQSGSGKQGYGAIHINGGADNTLENNVFMNCGKALSNTYWTNEKWKKTFINSNVNKKKLTETVDITSNTYLNRYPYLKDFFDINVLKERINRVNNTILINTPVLSTGKGYAIVQTRSFPNTVEFQFSKNDDSILKIINYPPSFKNLKGWKDIDFNSIGRK